MPTSILRLFSAFVVLVLLSFGATSLYLRHRARAIDRAALDISESAAPSITQLSAAHGELRELVQKAEQYVELAERGAFQSPKELTDLLADIHEKDRLHNLSPEFAGEHLASARTTEELAHVDYVVKQFIDAYMAHDLVKARQLAKVELRHAARHASDAIIVTIGINAGAAADRAEQIRALRVGLARSSVALSVSSVVWIMALVGLLIYATRRAALREAEHRLAHQRAQELELFAGRVAHDILNPVSVLTLLFKTVEAGPTAEQLPTIIARGRATLQRIQRILDGLLKFACAAARPEPGVASEVAPVLAELETELRVQAEAARIELRVEPFAPCRVACSAGILYSLTTNLAHNAIKYMGDGEQRLVTLRVLDCGSAVRIEVEDTGPGLSVELQQSAFRPFVRGSGTTQAGFGIGLATVQRAAEAHGGRVGVRSALGRGSVFWFELPRL